MIKISSGDQVIENRLKTVHLRLRQRDLGVADFQLGAGTAEKTGGCDLVSAFRLLDGLTLRFDPLACLLKLRNGGVDRRAEVRFKAGNRLLDFPDINLSLLHAGACLQPFEKADRQVQSN